MNYPLLDSCKGFYLGEATSQLKKKNKTEETRHRKKIKRLQNKADVKSLNKEEEQNGNKPDVTGTVQSALQEVFRMVKWLYW